MHRTTRDNQGSFDLQDRWVLLTGASGHLGRAIAIGLARAGARVILNARSQEKLQKLADDIGAFDGKAKIAAFDIADESEVLKFARAMADGGEPLFGVVNNAYRPLSGNYATASMADFDASYRTNVGAAFFVIQQCLPLLEAAAAQFGHASVVNVASMYGHVSPPPALYSDLMPNPPFYGASKAALLQLTRYLACFLADKSIRVNSVSPGPFPMEAVAVSNPEFVERLQTHVPLGRLGKPAELVGPVVFLLSDAASFVTGADLKVDGGWCAK